MGHGHDIGSAMQDYILPAGQSICVASGFTVCIELCQVNAEYAYFNTILQIAANGKHGKKNWPAT